LDYFSVFKGKQCPLFLNKLDTDFSVFVGKQCPLFLNKLDTDFYVNAGLGKQFPTFLNGYSPQPGAVHSTSNPNSN
jgi:hypothetical protein